MRTIVEVPKVSFPQYLTCHGYKLGTECWIRFQFAYLLDKISLIFLKKKKKNPYVCFILKAGFFRQLSKKFFCKNIILDTQMSLHKNYFDRWQARFFLYLYLMWSLKRLMYLTYVFMSLLAFTQLPLLECSQLQLRIVCISKYCDQIGMDLEYEIVLSVSHPH